MNYSKNCSGCGVLKQNKILDNKGYVKMLTHILCIRCFNIRFHNKIIKNNSIGHDWLLFLNNLNLSQDDWVFYVVSLDNIIFNQDINLINSIKKNRKVLIVNKVDLFSKNVSSRKIYNYVRRVVSDWNVHFEKIILLSANKNIGLDNLYKFILFHDRPGASSYFLGISNSGKSTIINKLIHNYNEDDSNNLITTSPYLATTLGLIEITIINKEDKCLKIIDTPGIIANNLDEVIDYNLTNPNIFKQSKVLKPITYNLYESKAIIYEGIGVFIYKSNHKQPNVSFHFYKNNLVRLHLTRINNVDNYWNNNYERFNIHLTEDFVNFKEHIFEINNNNNHAIHINGVGFIKFNNARNANIILRFPKNIRINLSSENILI